MTIAIALVGAALLAFVIANLFEKDPTITPGQPGGPGGPGGFIPEELSE